MLRVYLLGSFRVLTPTGERVLFATRSAETLMAFLALHRGRRFRRQALLETLWPGRDSAESATYLRQQVWRLRSALGDSAGTYLHAERDEIWLGPEGVWTDLAAFLDSGDLDLLSGPLLDGWTGDWVDLARSHAEQEITAGLAHHARQALGSGKAGLAVRLAEQVLRADPLNEEGYGLVMQAEMARGNHESALSYFRRCRTELQRNLGVDPAPDLQRLASEARRLSGLTRAPRPQGDMVGRSTELQALVDLLRDSSDSRKKQAVILGEPGIGKSRLLTRFLEVARGSDVRTVTAQCDASASPPPYYLLSQILQASPRGELLALPKSVRSGLSLLLPEFGAAVPGTPGESRLRVLSAAREAFRHLSSTGTLVIAVEDMHWADPASIQALATILPEFAAFPLFLLMTCRTDGLADREELRQWYGIAEGSGKLLRLHLGPLNQQECALLAERLSPALSPIIAAWVYQESQGNPLFVTELLRAVPDRDAHPPEETPPGLARLLHARLLGLPPEARRLLEAASILGLSFQAEQAIAVAGGADPDPDLEEELAGLIRRGLLVEKEERCSFFHARFREVVLAQMSDLLRRSLHRRAARLAFPAPSLAAYHAEQGRDWTLAFRHLLAAGRAAASVGEAAEAAALFTRSIRCAESAGDVPYRDLAEAMLEREAALSALGAVEEQTRDLDSVDALALKHHDTSLAVEGAVRRALLWDRLGRFSEADREAERAVMLARRLGEDSAELAKAKERHAWLAWSRGLTRAWISRSRSALETARRSGSLLWEGRALQQLASACHYRGQYDRMREYAEAALAVSMRLGDRLLHIEAGRHLAWYHLIRGEEEQAYQWYGDLLALARGIGDLTSECMQLYLSAVACSAVERLEEALEHAGTARSLSQRLQNPKLQVWANCALSHAQLLAGEYKAALALALEARDGGARTGSAHDLGLAGLHLAHAQLALGQVGEAAAWARSQSPAAAGRTPAASLRLAVVATEALCAAEQADRARQWAGWTRRWRTFLGEHCVGALRWEAMVAEAAGQGDSDSAGRFLDRMHRERLSLHAGLIGRIVAHPPGKACQ